MKSYLFKIPYKCLFKIVNNPQLLKAYCIYGKIKHLTYNLPYWKDYAHTKTALAKALGVSYNTLTKYVRILISYGLAWEEKNNLRLAHKYKIYELVDEPIHINEHNGKVCTRNLALTFEQLTPEYLFKEAIKLKKQQTEFRQKQAIKKVLTNEVGQIHSDNIGDKMKKSINNKTNNIYNKYCNNLDYNFKGTRQSFGFLDNNLSLNSYAKMLGRKTKTTASRWLKKLEAKNMIVKKQRAVCLGTLSKNENISMYRNNFHNGTFRLGNRVFLATTLLVTIV